MKELKPDVLKSKEAVVAQFGKNASQYVTSANHAKGADLQDLVQAIQYNEGMKALDVATGGGHVANALATHVQEVTALDLTPEILQQAEAFIQKNNHQNVTFVQGDAEQLPFADESFDLVTCRIAAHHFPNVPHFVQEVYRVLKKGGQFALIDNISPEDDLLDSFYNIVEKKRDYSHFRALKKTEWISLVEKSGFYSSFMKTYEKKFKFKEWTERMQLPLDEKEALNQYMLEQSEQTKEYFKLVEEDGSVQSFVGSSILLHMYKR
ncbi:class I SAM-dependent methyltransferase [Bacillus horti]|uniref:Ubiquinone/menaquinone biosynthesis C-methylase UbiE n=1 Tax=Caldalkalibacillus horti TaxID=77523 RepID=A0ABT9W092_9BACI|nr:class I SAM-dependent methyltransferase [Bacillus horti]MDQ0166674.1 ubiquinone/menaquinone biosynthesis C-methylase UbiE [Bacillus horti]